MDEPRFPDGRPEAEQPEWRRDFPIDWPQDAYMGRREFTKFLVLTSLAFSVGQVLIALEATFPSPEPGESLVARTGDLAVGQSRTFAYPTAKDPCILVRLASDKFVAYSQRCTHLSCAVVPQPERGRFFCPCHNGAFDLATGTPIMGPPRRGLPRIRLSVRGDSVYATGVEYPGA